MNMDIDLVYLWCDGSDGAYQQKVRAAQEQLKLSLSAREYNGRSSDHDELRYSLRSVEQFAPWVHHIYIVTDNQIPDWLDVNHPKITIVNHKDIIPEKYLPTFNSNVIDAFIHKIPGLSEYFLYANDDTFFARPTDPDFFLSEDGKPIHYVYFQKQYQTNYFHWLLRDAKKLAEEDVGKYIKDAVFSSHNIELYRKSAYAECVAHFEDAYRKMFSNKFRKNNDVQRFLYSCWGMMKGQIIWKDLGATGNLNKVRCIDALDERTFLDFINTKKPNLCCLNDMTMSDEEDIDFYQQIYQKLFPQKSSFEIKDVVKKPLAGVEKLAPAFDKNNIPIVLMTNENSFACCLVAVRSILDHISEQYNYDIIICTNNIYRGMFFLADEIETPKNVRIRCVPIDFILKRQCNLLDGVSYEQISQWSKIFLPRLLKEYDSVICLDADVLVNCDVADLFNLNKKDACVCGSLDFPAHEISGVKQKKMREVFHCDNIDDYINLSVMVMNLDLLRKGRFEENALKLLVDTLSARQDFAEIFNAVLHGKIHVLPPEYNYCEALEYVYLSLYSFFPDDIHKLYQETTENGAKIIHFINKPWNIILGKYSLQWWKTAQNSPAYELILSRK